MTRAAVRRAAVSRVGVTGGVGMENITYSDGGVFLLSKMIMSITKMVFN